MKEKITIHDIAGFLGVSPSTVSRALNNHPRISAATRQEIQQLALNHGYQPNNLASSLRKGKSMTIGVVVPRINRHFFSNVIGGMEVILNAAGYNLLICQSQEDYLKEVSSLKSLQNLRVDGIFISMAAGSLTTDHIRDLLDKGNRIILFDRVDEALPARKVVLDDYMGAFLMVSDMLKQGYRRIAHFAGPENITAYRHRLKAFRDAMEKGGSDPAELLVFKNTISRESGYESMQKIIHGRGIKPDAIFAASDFSALGALLAAREAGLDVPGEMGIAGFGNEPFTELIQPSLSTVEQKAGIMGRKVAELFLNMDQPIIPETKIISPEIICRKSTNKLNI